jgi:hypothetical protein
MTTMTMIPTLHRSSPVGREPESCSRPAIAAATPLLILVLGALSLIVWRARMTDAERAERFELYWREVREEAGKAVIVSGWRSIETVERVARDAFYAGTTAQP